VIESIHIDTAKIDEGNTVLNSALTEAPLLKVEGLRFRWPKARTDCLDIERFELQRGETTFLRGPSGCGKSTFLSLVAGVLSSDQGSVELLGHDWTRFSSTRRDRLRADHVGYIFQQFNLLPYLSMLDNVLLACRFSARRLERAGDAVKSAQLLLSKVGLGPTDWYRKASELSVGQQQRVAAARALIGQPDLVIADEPTSALDEALRESFMDLLLDACGQAGSALLFVSHDDRLAPRFQRQLDLTTINRAAQQ
jgi:putative ABC transport system ATP-binding protein